MTPEEKRAIDAQRRRNEKLWNGAMRALLWCGWKLDVDCEGTEQRVERFIWSARRGEEIHIVAADNYLSPLLELQRETGAQEPPDAFIEDANGVYRA